MGKIRWLVLTVFFLLLMSTTVYAVDVNSDELINNATKYDGREIIYTGEVIGDVMKRGNSAWMNVYDGSNAIGVWVSDFKSLDIHTTGAYGYKGDTVTVHGIFNKACSEHGGDFDIHSNSIDVIKRGNKIDVPVSSSKKLIAAVLLIVSAGLTLSVHKRNL